MDDAVRTPDPVALDDAIYTAISEALGSLDITGLTIRAKARMSDELSAEALRLIAAELRPKAPAPAPKPRKHRAKKVPPATV